ncbi:MAG: Mrp/NBP35 family ATP-binding protein [Firmicutes bacterium]|nr:Mrp/NBP35 family ATP-binding protein [Clostridiales bacterium]MBQ9931668.1 Mrp/NBP35 family ATP-binding protein [Bacillota bacterium]
MSQDCNHDCSSCGASCSERTEEQVNVKEKPHEMSNIKKVIGVVSGKGGVGKSLVTSILAVQMQRQGFKSAILDADVTGPSIPKVFGLHDKAQGSALGIAPSMTKTGIGVMSVNLLLENETDPVVWRGPMIAGVVKQFWTDVVWGDVDYMFVDMPPGTGDVPLTVFQSLPLDGIIVVASPQELVGLIVEKAVVMANLMDVPVLGLVENMSYFKCPDCGKEHHIFGESHIDEIAKKYGIETVSKLPMIPALAAAVDAETFETFELEDALDEVVEMLIGKMEETEN